MQVPFGSGRKSRIQRPTAFILEREGERAASPILAFLGYFSSDALGERGFAGDLA